METNVARNCVLLPPLLLALAACGSGGGGGTPLAGGGGGGGGGGGTTLQPTIESIQAGVFDQLCISCHIGATAPRGLRLDDANAFALLVGIASSQNPALLLVDPSNPDDSYLIDKLEGTHTVGGQMPLGGTPMPQADIDVVRQWISDGALPTMGPPPTAPIRVSSLSPAPGSSMPVMPFTIMAVFDRELSAATVDLTTFLVTRSGGDGVFGNGNDVAIVADSVTVPLMNPMTAIFDMSSTAAVPDTYQVTLIGSGGTTIQDLDTNAVDGEFSGTFPSGDGTAGGDFVAEFTVDGVLPTLTSIQDNVFTPTCAGCHSGPGGSAGLDLSSLSASFTALVNVVSPRSGIIFADPTSDPDNSYLIQKLEGAAGIMGQQMPRGAPALDQATIDVIRQWITDGAQM